jgi:hypothetical protein
MVVYRIKDARIFGKTFCQYFWEVNKLKDPKREIMGLALLLEDVSDLTVFLNYSGHVKGVSVRVFENDGTENETKLIDERFYNDFSCGTQTEYEAIKIFLQTKIDEYTQI